MTDSQPGLDEKFKDTDDSLRLVFVCAMWLTGFDAPSCSTIYLDKPMRNHSLMQTIVRANRVFPGKHSGVIVDYANVFASLEKALAIYGKGTGGKNPVKDKAKLSPNAPDISEIMQRISGLLDESISGLTIREAGPPAIDLSKINFEALSARFKTSSHKNTEIEALKAAIRARLSRLVMLNPTRTNFAEKFEELEEELVLSDILTQPARSSLRLAIEDTLASGLPRAYAPHMYRQKCSAVFEHVYESYPERGVGVYAGVGEGCDICPRSPECVGDCPASNLNTIRDARKGVLSCNKMIVDKLMTSLPVHCTVN